MKQRNYENERDVLLNANTPNCVPSRAFIREFTKRLDRNLSHLPNIQLGEALFGKRVDGKTEYKAMKLEEWIKYYEAKDKHDIILMIELLKRIHG